MILEKTNKNTPINYPPSRPIGHHSETLEFAKRYFAVFVALNVFFRIFRLFGKWNMPEGWPTSEGRFRLPSFDGLIFVAGALILVTYAYKNRDWIPDRFWAVLGFAVAFLVLSNGFHGAVAGYVDPLITPASEGGPQEYYQDISKVLSTRHFLENYTKIQPSLLIHSRSHPPGPVLLMRWSADLLRQPMCISIVLGCLSLVVMGCAFRVVLKSQNLEHHRANFITLLLLCCTPVQVYTLFSIDGVIAALASVLLAFLLAENRSVAIFGSAVTLAMLLMLSFGSVFFAPVILYALWRKKRIGDGLAILVMAGSLVGALCPLFGFSWLDSFRIAGKMENPHGFRLFEDPISFISTRLEDVFEPILFVGPYLFMFIFRRFGLGRAEATKTLGSALMVVSVLVLLAIFLTGAYHTGETARACLFMVPFLVLGISGELADVFRDDQARRYALKWVVGYTFVVQAVMYYFW